jgi:integrase
VPAFDPIEYLFSRRYPTWKIEIPRFHTLKEAEVIATRSQVREKALAYEQELRGKTPAEIADLVKVERAAEAEQHRRKQEAEEKARHFNQPAAMADFSHWGYADAAYFTPACQDEWIASGVRFKPVPEPEEIEKVLRAMPDDSDIAKRDRAIIAIIFLTDARDRAVSSLKLKHLDIDTGKVFQDAREVKTKRAKTFVTQFFPVGKLSLNIMKEWVIFLTTVKGFGADDPPVPGYGGGAAWHGAVRHYWPFPTALADNDANPQNLQDSLRTRRPSILQSA